VAAQVGQMAKEYPSDQHLEKACEPLIPQELEAELAPLKKWTSQVQNPAQTLLAS